MDGRLYATHRAPTQPLVQMFGFGWGQRVGTAPEPIGMEDERRDLVTNPPAKIRCVEDDSALRHSVSPSSLSGRSEPSYERTEATPLQKVDSDLSSRQFNTQMHTRREYMRAPVHALARTCTHARSPKQSSECRTARMPA